MKLISLLAAFLLVGSCVTMDFSQAKQEDLPPWNEVRQVQFSKEQIYTRSSAWFVQFYVSAKSVIEMDDKSSGIIMGVGATPFTYNMVSGNLEYLLKIEPKDGKYRISMDRLCASGATQYGPWKRCAPNITVKEAEIIKQTWLHIVGNHHDYITNHSSTDF